MPFYPNECFICQATSFLKRCSRCNMISYCGEIHQKIHWKYHKDICKVISDITSDWGVSHIYEDLRNVDRKKWLIERKDRMEIVLSRLTRPFIIEEIEMFQYPRACFVCHDVTQNLLRNCPGCPLASFCKDHPSSPLHDKDCSKIQNAHELELQMDPKSVMMSDMISTIMKNTTNSVPTSIENFIENGVRRHAIFPECVKFCLSEYLSAPLSIYNALQKLKASNKTEESTSKMVIHIRGLSRRYVFSNSWELLFHLLPELTNLNIIIADQRESSKMEVHDLCHRCISKKKKLFVDSIGMYYFEYSEEISYQKPDIMAVFNITPPEYETHEMAWMVEMEVWNKLSCPLVLTANTERKLKLTTETLRSNFWNTRIFYEGINDFATMYSIREWEDWSACKNSKYIVVIKNSKNIIADLGRENKQEKLNMAISKFQALRKFQEPTKKAFNVFFSPSLCHFCQVNNTYVTCQRCKMIFYCGENHLKADLPQHKDICKVILKMLIETGAINIFNNLKTSDSESWLMAKINLMKEVKTNIGRELEEFEKEMILFPKTCFICHESDLSVMRNCECGIVLCKIHKKHSKHKEICSDYYIAMKLKMNKYLPSVIAYVLPDLFDKTEDIIPSSIETFIDSYLRSMKSISLNSMLPIMQNMIISDTLSMAFSLLYAILKFNLFSEKKLKIHILGVFHSELEERGFWLVLNCLKNLKMLELSFFNPFLNSKQPPNYKLDIVFTDLSFFGKKKFEVSAHGILYNDYCTMPGIEKPHIIMGYNLNIHEIDYEISAFNWKDIIFTLKRMNIPFAMTSESEERAKKCHRKLCSVLEKEVEFFSCNENPYASLFPKRDFESEGLRYSNKWITLYKDFNKKVTSKTIVQKKLNLQNALPCKINQADDKNVQLKVTEVENSNIKIALENKNQVVQNKIESFGAKKKSPTLDKDSPKLAKENPKLELKSAEPEIVNEKKELKSESIGSDELLKENLLLKNINRLLKENLQLKEENEKFRNENLKLKEDFEKLKAENLLIKDIRQQVQESIQLAINGEK